MAESDLTAPVDGIPIGLTRISPTKPQPSTFDDPASDQAAPSDEELEAWSEFGRFVQLALRTATKSQALTIPETIGPFRVLRILGQGGNATVYLAQDASLPRAVAIKVPHANLLRLPGTRERFLQEAQLIAGLQHPHIVEIHQIGQADELPYLVFEYCEGGSLADWLAQRNRPLTPRTCAEITKTLASAVHYAHCEGILHRDLNPRNVLLVPDPAKQHALTSHEFPFIPKLSDFGLGTWLDADQNTVRTQTGAVIGTIPYMAPEQLRGPTRFLQPTVDVHGLGVMLYEMLSQERPYIGATPMQTLHLIQDSPPPSLRRNRKNVSRDLETICFKCLEKSSANRFPTALLLADDLDRYLDRRPILSRRASLATRAVQWMTRYPLVTCLAGIICLLTGLIGSGAWWYSSRLESSLRTAGELQSQSRENQNLIQSMAYAGQIRRAQELLDGGYQYTAGQLLRDWIPERGRADRRGFEWYYLLQATGGEMLPIPRQATSENSKSLYSGEPGPDGRHLYIGIPGAIEKWNLTNQTLEATLPLAESEKSVREICARPNSNLLFAYAESSRIHRFSSQDDQELTPFCETGNGTWCNRIVKSADDRLVISLINHSAYFSPSSQIRCHDLRNGQLLWDKSWSSTAVCDLAFDATDGNTVVIAGDSLVTLDQRGQTVREMPFPSTGTFALSLAISKSGAWLAISLANQRVLIYRKRENGHWEPAGELPIAPVAMEVTVPPSWSTCRNPVRFAEAETLLYSATGTELHLWDVARKIELNGVQKLPHPIRMLKLLPDRRTAVWGTAYEAGIWRPRIRLPQIDGHDRETWTVDFSPDGKYLATGSDDETVRLWEIRTGKEVHKLTGHTATVSTVAFSPDGTKLASASLDQTIRIWNIDKPTEVQTLTGHSGTIRCLNWSADGKLMITGERNATGQPVSVIVWDVAKQTTRHIWKGHHNRVQTSLFINNDRLCVTAGFDKLIVVRDLQTGETILTMRDTDEVHCGAILNHGRWLATGNKLGLIRIWDLKTGRLHKELRGHAVTVRSLAASADGMTLASGSEDTTVRLWDVRSGESLLVLRGHKAPVNSVAFSPDDEILASGAHDGSVKLWHAPRASLETGF